MVPSNDATPLPPCVAMNDGAAPRAEGARAKTRTAANASPSRRNITASLDADRSITPPAPNAFPRDQENCCDPGKNRPIPGEMRRRDRRGAPRGGVERGERPPAPPVDRHRLAVWRQNE